MSYTTPGSHGYTPRDLDWRRSLVLPLAKDLAGWGAPPDQTISESAQAAFQAYRALHAKVTGWYAATSDRRAELAN
eukprot:9580680-Alexandrium_andersonii.AAC.1